MAIFSLFEIRLDSLNIKLADKLNLLTINVPIDVAQKQAKLREKGLGSPDLQAVETNVTFLTNYLIQTSYIATIRSLIKAIQLADKLRRVNLEKQRKVLEELVEEFIGDLYSHRLIASDGSIIQDTGVEVLKLFNEICQYIFNDKEDIDESKFAKFLASRQEQYVRLVLERTRRLTTTIESVGITQAVNEKIEKLLNNIETANLGWLIETYTLDIGGLPNTAKLPEIDNRTQKQIADSVLLQMEQKVRTFDEETKQGKQRTLMGILRDWVRIGNNRTIDLSQTNLLDTEHFVIALRLHISYRQQITILSSILDKINEFSAMLNSFEAVVSAADRATLLDFLNRKKKKRHDDLSSSLNSSDVVDVALMALSKAASRPLEAEIELQGLLKEQDEELAKEVTRLRDFFSKKSETSNKVIASLAKLGNTVRVMSPMVIKEAGQRDASFTTDLLAQTRDCIKEINKLEGNDSQKVIERT